MIEAGAIIELTENELRSICAGEISAPEPQIQCDDTMVFNASNKDQNEYEMRKVNVLMIRELHLSIGMVSCNQMEVEVKFILNKRAGFNS